MSITGFTDPKSEVLKVFPINKWGKKKQSLGLGDDFLV